MAFVWIDTDHVMCCTRADKTIEKNAQKLKSNN